MVLEGRRQARRTRARRVPRTYTSGGHLGRRVLLGRAERAAGGPVEAVVDPKRHGVDLLVDVGHRKSPRRAGERDAVAAEVQEQVFKPHRPGAAEGILVADPGSPSGTRFLTAEGCCRRQRHEAVVAVAHPRRPALQIEQRAVPGDAGPPGQRREPVDLGLEAAADAARQDDQRSAVVVASAVAAPGPLPLQPENGVARADVEADLRAAEKAGVFDRRPGSRSTPPPHGRPRRVQSRSRAGSPAAKKCRPQEARRRPAVRPQPQRQTAWRMRSRRP